MVKFLVQEQDMDIELRTTGDAAGGCTPLVLACIENSHSVVSWLIAAGANKEALVQDHGTVLCFVCYVAALGRFEEDKPTTPARLATIKLLLEHGAEATAMNSKGHTPLFTCALTNCVVRY
jgi:ankyrin repeat protein